MSFNAAQPLPYNASDPNATFLSASSLDFLLIELVPLSQRIAAAQVPPPTTTKQSPQPDAQPASHGEDDEEVLDAMKHRLDSVGYRVGQGLVEK